MTKKDTETICSNCHNKFLAQAFRVRDLENGKRKHLFCCRKCESEFRKSQSELNCICDFCGKVFHRKPNQIKRNKKFNVCSQECNIAIRSILMRGDGNHQFGLIGELNDSWKSNERISNYGYRLIRNLEHPFKNCDGFVFEHRLIAEQYLLTNENSIIINDKQYLSPEFIVHHKDFEKLNNNVDNLVIMKLDEHTRYHALLREINKNKITEDKLLIFYLICQKYRLNSTN